MSNPSETNSARAEGSHGILRRLARQRRVLARSTLLMQGAWVWIGATIASILLDAGWPLSGASRLIIAALLLAGLIAVVVRLRLPREDSRATLLREAARVERSFDLPANLLINSLWLAPLAAGGADMPAQLSRRAMQAADRALADVDSTEALDRRPLRLQLRYLAIVVVAVILLTTLQPQLITGGLARLVDPWGDHPPFSLTQFDLSLQPRQVHAGQDAMVEARLTGGPLAAADLVEVDEHGQALRRWPMDAGPPDGAAPPGTTAVFQRRLRSLRQPMIVQVETPTGRSHRLRITPIPDMEEQPPVLQAPSLAAPNMDQTTTRPALSDGNNESGAGAAGLRAAMTHLGVLAESAHRIRALAAELLARFRSLQAGDQPIPPWLAQQIETLRQRVAGNQASATALARQMDELADAASAAGADPQLIQFLRRTSQMLSGLKLPQANGQPYDAGDVEHMTAADAVNWLEQLIRSSAQDASALESQLADPDAVRSGLAGVGSPSANGDVVPPPLAAGHTTEQNPAGGSTIDPTAAIVQKAPPEYRDLVNRYFTAIARDQNKETPRP